MVSLELFLTPELRTSNLAVSRLLRERGGGYDTLFLSLPMELEEALMEYSSGRISYGDLLEEARRGRLIPEPIGSWEYASKPLLESLPHLSEKFPGLLIRCYCSTEHEFSMMDAAVKTTALTLRVMTTGRVDAGEWLEALRRSLEAERDAREAELQVVLSRMGGASACVADLGRRGLERPLAKAGVDVKIRYVERPYHFTPLEILKRLILRGAIGYDEVERYVRCHVEYVRGYIYGFRSRDRAYYEWVYDKVPWMRWGIKRDEIEALDSLIREP